MLNCKQVIELASDSLDREIPWHQRSLMKLHLLICKTCQRYLVQLQFMQKAAAEIDSHCRHIVLSSVARKRIRNKINTPQK